MCLRAGGADLRVEEASSCGRADMVVCHCGQVFVLEFKMAQRRGYVDKYGGAEPVHLMGVTCGREARNLLDVCAEPASEEGNESFAQDVVVHLPEVASLRPCR